jgi:hypothetical protein
MANQREQTRMIRTDAKAVTVPSPTCVRSNSMLLSVLTSPPGSIETDPIRVAAEKIDTAIGTETLAPRP